MRTKSFYGYAKLTPIVAILALAACDQEPTTAEAPIVEDEAIVEEETATVEETAPAVEEETALAEEPIVEEPAFGEAQDEVAVIEPETEGETATTAPGTTDQAAGTEVEPVIEGGGEAEVTVITPEGTGETTAAADEPLDTTGEATGAISATTAAAVDPGTYASDQLSLELSEAGTFTLTGPDGEAVEGDWRVFGDTMTLTNVEGATGDATFPMTCTIAADGEGFRIAGGEGTSCEMLAGQVFQPQG